MSQQPDRHAPDRPTSEIVVGHDDTNDADEAREIEEQNAFNDELEAFASDPVSRRPSPVGTGADGGRTGRIGTTIGTARPVARMGRMVALILPPRSQPHEPAPAWFTEIPDWFDPDGGLIQFDWETGRVAAMVALYGDCIPDGSKQCWSPPVSNTGYEYAHVGTCVLEDGETIRVATIGGGVPHASPGGGMSIAQDHYANTATRKLVGGTSTRPEAGGSCSSVRRNPLTYADVYDTPSSAVSGDWR